MAKGKGLSEEGLNKLLDQKLSSSTIWYNSSLSSEREKVLKYYNGELPRRLKDSSSSYVSNEVYDAVEAMKSQLLETFAAGREIVKFDPKGPEDIEAAKIATQYTDYVVFSQNPGYSIFSEIVQDGLLARAGVAKVYWDEDYEDTEEEFEGVPEEGVVIASSHPEVQTMDAEQGPDGSYKGKLVRRKSLSQCRIEPLNPEEFGIEENAKDLSNKWFKVHKTWIHIDDLVKLGFTREEIEEAGNATDVRMTYGNSEQQTRTQLTPQTTLDSNKSEDDFYQVNECYVRARLKGDACTKTYKVLKLGNKVLDKEEIDDHPFVGFVPLPIPHAFYGNNFASRVIPTQNIRTALTRAIVDHASVTTNPRWTVLKGALTNPRELLDNRLGGLVNVTRPDAVQPLEQAPLNPFVFQALELLKAQNEETTGISALSQGLNKDAVSKQNSDAMVERLVTLSQTRQKIIARNFAQNFLIPLYLKVYDVIIKNEDKKKIFEVAGNWVEVEPAKWSARAAATCSLHLGYREQDRAAMELVQTGALFNQDPRLQRMFTDENRYKMATDVMKLRGQMNYIDYLTPPDKLPPEPPNPEMMKMEIEHMKAQAALINAQAAAKKVDIYGQIELSRKEDEAQDRIIEGTFRERDEARKDAEVANRIEIANREMDLAESQPLDKSSGIISPR